LASIIYTVDEDEGARSGVLPDGEVVLDVEEMRPERWFSTWKR
jgi:hypothetical protein